MRELIHITDGMKDLILNNWYPHVVKNTSYYKFEYQPGQQVWMEESMEGHYYGPFDFYDWNESNSNKHKSKFYFEKSDDKVLFELTWG